MNECPPFDLNQTWLPITFYIFGCITLPINIVAAYIIIDKSTIAMKDYRWYLLGNHLAISLFDFHSFFLNVAELFFPFTIGLCHGLIQVYNYLPLYQTAIQYSMIASVLASIHLLYFYRWQVLLPEGHFLSLSPKTTRFYVIFTYCWIMIPVLYFNLRIAVFHDNEKAKIPYKNYTCLLPLIDLPGLGIGVAEETHDIMPMFAVQMAIGILLTSFQVIHISWIIHSTGSFISAETKRLQIKFLITLNIQVWIPATFLIIPAFCIIHIFFYQIYGYQELGNIIYLILSCHGLVSTITMLMVNEPFRTFIFTKLHLQSNVIGTVENSQNTSSNLNPSRST